MIKLSHKEEIEICAYRNKGATVRQLATRYGCSVGLIHKVLKRNNLTNRSFSFDD
ncbi:helix-turn-helix domain-containing protein [Photobacterium piscicola]|uniref:helix-turn-helix domain-containing protein n=1 Tax=Photobacterium piscicola TaxID=1378299 RepID=UPI0037367B83